VSASTVFGLTLALIVGLALATAVKLFILDRRAKAAPAEAPKVKLTVAAVNILDKQQVASSNLKTIQVSRERYDEYLARARELGTKLLEGNQPVNRTTIKPVPAEEPFYENQFEPLGYPESLKERLADGKRAVIVEVPSKQAMVQVGDRVDLLCTLSNETPAFGTVNGSATAALAKDVRVVARFNTTRTAAQPPTGNNRTYTLEVEPWQFAAVELAKAVGGQFSMGVTARSGDNPLMRETPAAFRDDNAYKSVKARYEATNRVTTAELALLFGVQDPPPRYRLERFAGNSRLPTLEFRSAPKPAEEPAGGVRPAVGPEKRSDARSGGGETPATYSPSADGSVAKERVNNGFKPVANQAEDCPTCAKKK
jgi:Flp pilus assembly protein CpaB